MTLPESVSGPDMPLAVLLGGGVESTLLLTDALREGRTVVPVHIHCGLLWDDAEAEWVGRFLEARACAILRPLVAARLSLKEFLGQHWAADGRDVPRADANSARLEIPLRNLTLLGLATHSLRKTGYDRFELCLGTTADNHYADGSRTYFDLCEPILSLEADFPVRIRTPLITLHKKDVLLRSDRETLSLSFSCVNPQFDNQSGRSEHCGQCIKCGSRRTAFREAGIPDPTRYLD